MSAKAISTVSFNNNTLHLSEYKDGFWLYDDFRGMNLSMRAESPEIAFIRALGYYQNRLKEIETKYKSLSDKVNNFINQFTETEEN